MLAPGTSNDSGPPHLDKTFRTRLAGIPSVYAYVAVVTVVGLAVLGVVVATSFHGLAEASPGVVLLFTPLVVLGELAPIRVRRRDGEEEITSSTTFAFALLLTCGAAAGALSLALASLIADLFRRKPLWKALFNVAQFSLSIGVAAAAVGLVRPGTVYGTRITAGELPALITAALLFFLVNNTVTGTAMALAEGTPVRSFLRRDFLFQAGTTGVLLSLAPIVVAAANNTLLLVPFFLMPIAAVHKCASILLAKEHEAAHDPLTGLPNRKLYRERAVEAVTEADRHGLEVAVMLIDLDRFKEINDTLGHHIGDVLLQQIGPRLEAVLRRDDTIARLGGDEFAVLLHDVPDEATAMEVADRMLEALEQPFTLADVVLDIDASIGIALHPEHGGDIDTLLQKADVAMYLAKETRSGYQVYSPERDPYSPKRLTLLHEMRQAMDGGQFVLHFQPQADLASGRVIGVEALIRWQHPTHGLLPPDLFIPIAERSGFSRPLTLFVLEQSLEQVRQWHSVGINIGVAVNLTLRNLHDPTFPLDVARLLESSGVSSEWLQLEITESIVMADPGRVLGVLKALRDMGIQLALDDFGTGYSSLAHLKRLPVHELKIDKSFVMNMTRDESDAVIVQSTIDLARNLRLRTVAEGVEDIDSWIQLAGLGCDVAQGYYLSKPVPAAELTTWLRTKEPVTVP
ncbi:MAG: EAL domain-containing protein [Actinomycetota bacterium]|nr:EAL domain-containing protein [Actinomycetota bacterium]